MRQVPAEGLVDASLQLAAAARRLRLAAAAGDIRALEPPESRAAMREGRRLAWTAGFSSIHDCERWGWVDCAAPCRHSGA